MRRILASMGWLIAFGAVSGAAAADLPRKAAPVVTPAGYNWTGYYIGGFGGGGWNNTSWSFVPPSDQGHRSSGWLGGVTAGFNHQLANSSWVVGVEYDIAAADISGGVACGGFNCQTKVDWMVSSRARIGYSFNTAMLYVTGGTAWINQRVETRSLAGAATPPSGTAINGESKGMAGWTVGAGIEWAFAGPWSLKAEYLYFGDLGARTYSVDNGRQVLINNDISVVRGGINYRFFSGQLPYFR